ncbi:MAG: hypothetical protein Q9167_004091 [Letrouitia subvulpina]
MWRRLRSLSRSRRIDSWAESEASGPENKRKTSDYLNPTRLSRADTLTPGRFSDEAASSDSLGLSVLYAPPGAHAVDLIFLHGLGGASVRTWCKEYDRSLCWPKYWLPEDLGSQNVRVLTFGYNAEVLSKTKTKANISDFAKGLLAAMKFEKNKAMEDLGIGEVPIVFVVHSMGGLVFKKAYLRGRNDKEYEGIVSQIRAVLFLSTPHRGSNLAETLDKILSISLTGHTRKAFIRELASDSSTVEDLNENFRHQISDLEIFSFYELQNTVIKASQSVMVVSKDSALLGYSGEKSIPLEADHHNVCKYSSKQDANYRTVISVLKTVTSTVVDDGLIQNEKFASWMNIIDSAGVLWMHAGPGSGKSVKSSFLISHMVSLGISCQYFFFKYEDILKRSANTLFRALAFQAAQDMPSFRMALMKLGDEGAYNEKTEARQLWKTLFESTLFSLNFEKPLYWIIDALDESDSINIVISSFKSIPKELPIRIIITSRHLPSISTAFSRGPGSVRVDSLNIDNDNDDIRLFVEKEARYLPGDAEFHSVVTNQLIRRSQGNFLWVNLALQEILEIHSQEELDEILDEIPSGMDSMYQRMENCIVQLSKASDKSLAKIILTWATSAKRPLHIDELLHVLHPKFPSLLNLRNSISQVCGHFVTVNPSGKVALIHATARDYLRHSSKLSFTLESRAAHGELFDTTIQALMGLQLRSHLLSQKKIPPFYEYASTSWAYHLGRCSADWPNILPVLVKFFKGPNVLPWIETLAISRQMGSLVYSTIALTSFIQRRRRSDAEKSPLLHNLSDLKLLETWALDILKIVAKFGWYLLQDSTAIYRFIPQLCPLNSMIYQHFASSSLSQISVSGLSTADWDDLSSRLSVGTSHQASLICCSAKYVAVSTSAKTIMIWTTISFEEILTLSHDEHIFQICMNNTGDRLVSYGYRSTKVWTLPAGLELLYVPNLDHAKPINLTFFDNEKALLICSDTRDFRKLSMENPSRGWETVFPDVFKEETTVKDSFTNSPTSLSFNHDVSQVAVAYRGAPLEVWDLYSSKIVNRCKRGFRPGAKRKQLWTGVNHVLWHPVDHEVLGLYTDGTVFKWQPSSEVHVELAEASDSLPSDIQIAPNGNTFLTSDVHGTVKIHSFYDFTIIYQLSSEDVVTGMCFSPDSQRFYDIRGSYCNVWEPNALIRISEFNERGCDSESEVKSMSSISLAASEASVDPSASITCLAANAQCDLVCLGDDVGSVTLYDVNNDSKLQIAQSAIGMGIERILWSDDGSYLIYCDLSRKLTIVGLVEQRTTNSSFFWKTESVLETKIRLEGGVIRGLFANPGLSMLLAVGYETAQSWSILSNAVQSTFEIPSSGALWSNDPRDPTQLLAFNTNSVATYKWDTNGLNKVFEWELSGTSNKSLPSHAVNTPSGEYILLINAGYDRRQWSVVKAANAKPRPTPAVSSPGTPSTRLVPWCRVVFVQTSTSQSSNSRPNGNGGNDAAIKISLIMPRDPPNFPPPKFPPHSEPRVWLITSAPSPIGISLSRQLLAHGDFLILGTSPGELSHPDCSRGEEFESFWYKEVRMKEGWRKRVKVVEHVSQCQAAVAQGVQAFGRVDVLFCCTSEALVGTVEELAASQATLSLVREQFETNYFTPVNIIKAVLPSMRKRISGHIILLTSITGHLGTPGLGMYCASGWAIEGFCDSLAYEIAPFNIKMTILQPHLEIPVLTNKITTAPTLPQYSPSSNPAPLFRGILTSLLERIPSSSSSSSPSSSPISNDHRPISTVSSEQGTTSVYPNLPQQMLAELLAETINAVTAVGGHENPPARHIVGHEAVASVKEKLKTVSEELEEFVEVSWGVDVEGKEVQVKKEEEEV